MPIDDYYQEYGPIRRRRGTTGIGEHDQQPPEDPHTPREPRRREPRRRRPRRVRRNWWGCLLPITGLVLVLPLLALYGLNFVLRDQALPGVAIQGESVAGKNRNEIAAMIEHRYAEFLHHPIALVYRDESWQPPLADLGVRFDSEVIARQALAAGRQGDPLTRARELWHLWREGLELAPALSVDQRALQSYLLTLTPRIEYPPQDAALSIASAKIVGTPSTPGVQVLVDATANDILLALLELRPQEVTIRTRLLAPEVGDEALVEAQARVAEVLQTPLELQLNEQRWIWAPERLAELLQVEPVEDRLEVRVDPQRLARAVEGLAQLVDTGTAEPRLRFEAGTVRIIEEGRPGWRLRQEDAANEIANVLLSSAPTTRTLALPVDQLEPEITADRITELGINTLVAEGKSSFVGSAAYRITNIRAGSARMDGVLIAPGEEFSFNRQLGEVDAANGFVEGYAIIGNRTQLEWGGGVCQVSTTVFRSAFWAGLPITERHAHAFYISWYDRFGLGPNGDGQGLDAAIYTGVTDLKFVNDTGNWLLMQSRMDEANQMLTIELYGTPLPREVRLEGPLISNEVRAPAQPVYIDDPTLARGMVRQSDVARNGRDITIQRVLLSNGAEIGRDTFVTRFRAWPNIFLRGTG
ncbi:VanW family protein [Candidatus Chloroploca asiatica]|uniref:Vanomycin resistance protein VanB n=1 Tax=Candidatus Chloroploca asiatica TaxID=1506545 RepID=A0A2H3L3A8_9CHLR|nr:VanW family protein [Candidatus Chloroploca asiatica]PDW01118.1 vanomycin resistance protein VanB [Candidatus Chloroploca asiatica]